MDAIKALYPCQMETNCFSHPGFGLGPPLVVLLIPLRLSGRRRHFPVDEEVAEQRMSHCSLQPLLDNLTLNGSSRLQLPMKSGYSGMRPSTQSIWQGA